MPYLYQGHNLMSTKVGTYLDASAGAPLKLAAQEALKSLFEISLSNASSIHGHGRRAKRALAQAREAVAASLGSNVDPEQLLFTSSGSEANQMVVQSVLSLALQKKPGGGAAPRWITTAVEHDSNRQMGEWFQKQGGQVSILPVTADGAPRFDLLPPLLTPETALISMVWVNNETGVVTDLASLREKLQASTVPQVPVHLDAAQVWGKLPLDLPSLGVQYVTFSGHKIGALAGTGVLWLARGSRVQGLILGKQEKGRRGGTENLAGLVTLGAAAQTLQPLVWAERVAPLRDRLQKEICLRIPGTLVNGEGSPRVANTLNLSFEGIGGDGLVMALDMEGYSVSAGSACSSGVLEPSHVLLAMGRTRHQALAAIRISLSDELPWEVLEGFVKALEKVILRMRQVARQHSVELN